MESADKSQDFFAPEGERLFSPSRRPASRVGAALLEDDLGSAGGGHEGPGAKTESRAPRL